MTEEVKTDEVAFGKAPSFEAINRAYVEKQQALLNKEAKVGELVEKLKKLLREKIDAEEEIAHLDIELVGDADEDAGDEDEGENDETTEVVKPTSKKKKSKKAK